MIFAFIMALIISLPLSLGIGKLLYSSKWHVLARNKKKSQILNNIIVSMSFFCMSILIYFLII